MSNPYKNKIVYNGQTLIDLTGDTVTPETLLEGTTAHDASGAPITGNIATKTQSDISASGATVTVPAGYYSAQASKSVSTATQATPSVSVNTSTGLITATATQTAGYVSAGSKSGTSQLSVQAGKTVTPTESEQTAVAAGKYTTGAVKVGAISSTYVGSGITRRTSSDLEAPGNYVTVPAGYYASTAGKSVTTGTAGTPTATKGSVSNNSVSVTPSVTNTTGYITGSTKTGTAVTVTASELVSGTKSITENGTGIDVANYASVDVNVVPNRTATITHNGMYDIQLPVYSYVRYPRTGGTSYYTEGNTFEFKPGETLSITITLYSSGNITISVDGESVFTTTALYYEYIYTLPDSDIEIALDNTYTKNDIEITTVESGSITVNPLSVTQNGTYTAPTGTAYSPVTVNVPGSSPNLQAKTNISPKTSSQTITADAGYDGLSSVQINAMPSGTAGTPTATKGTVSDHAVTVTPSVTNTTGYITGGTKTGTAVTVSASELVSGSQTITDNGTVNVTNLASVDVQIPFVTYYTGTSNPSSSTGSNGDIYLKVVS